MPSMSLTGIDLSPSMVVRQPIVARLAAGTLITFAFAVVARATRGVSVSGAVVGFLISLLLYVCAGAGAFVVLIVVFALTWVTTRLGYWKKQNLGTAERNDGRTASQVFANLGVPAVAVLLSAWQNNSIYLLAAISALAEASADTVSSEYGQATGRNPRLITNWEAVPTGTDGAITAAGTLAGVLAAFIVSLVAVAVGLLPILWAALSTGAAVLGMLCDSVLGAEFERRQWLNNDAVNFLSTLIAAIAAVLVRYIL
jgi:uncharacterized protein (TIGR00297 family)